MGLDLGGTHVLVTGASSGIGAALAPLLAERGVRRLVLVGRREDRLDEVATRCIDRGAEVAEVRAVDLGDLDAAEGLATDAWDTLGHLDVIVNNAAMPLRRLASELTAAEVDEVMRVNFASPARITLAVLGRMLARGVGQVVNVSSAGGRLGIYQEAAYCASKFALTGWSESLALDLWHTGVDVRLITPGAIDTEIWDRPGNAPSHYDGSKDTPRTAAAAIVGAIEGDDFETFVPDLIDVVRWKTGDIQSYLEMCAVPGAPRT